MSERVVDLNATLTRARGPKRLAFDRSLRGWVEIARRCNLLNESSEPPPVPPVANDPQAPSNADFDAEFGDDDD